MARVVSMSGRIKARIKMTATIDVRYSFTAQFLVGAALFARRAREIEDTTQPVTTIMQSVAAIEAEISETIIHGPGHHLGSNGMDKDARDFLLPLANVLDNCPSLERYELVLHLLQKSSLNRGAEPFQAAALLVRLRNELVHYKSVWGKELESKKLIKQLKQLRFKAPSFIPKSSNLFPHKILCSSCASWSVTIAKEFINRFYAHLNIKSPLEPYESKLTVPEIRQET
jgi:hypothetical protein